MSAGICIMNKHAIAMAADSAVTIGEHAAIHNSVNKLFSISRVAPVGIIIYGNADFMSVPMEIIIKQYKKHLGDNTFDKLEDYKKSFIEFLEKNSDFLRLNINEHLYINSIFDSVFNIIRSEYNIFLQEQKTTTEDFDINNFSPFIIEILDKYIKKQTYNFSEHLYKEYKDSFFALIRNDNLLKGLSDNKIEELFKKTCFLLNSNSDLDSNNYLGFTIAGYGENEIYPSLFHLHFYGMIESKLKYKTVDNYSITENDPSKILPMAQKDVMQTFIFGTNKSFIDDLLNKIPQEIVKCVASIDVNLIAQDNREEISKKISQTVINIFNGLFKNVFNNYWAPLKKSTEFLPLDELTLLAETLISITSLRRKVINDPYFGTVGGPIDVAVISKGDGFIWAKRKHYFDKDLNPQYFYSHYNFSNKIENTVEKSDESLSDVQTQG